MDKQQAWAGGHELRTFVAIVWCLTSCMPLSVAATSEVSSAAQKNTMPKLVVEGVVYCEGLQSQLQPLKGAEVKVECTSRGKTASEVGRTDTRGTFSVTLQDYDYQAWGSNGCHAKLLYSSSRTTCTTPTNMGGGLTGTNLSLEEKSNGRVVLTAGPFAFKQSQEKAAAIPGTNLQKSVATKDSGSNSLRTESGLWHSPPKVYHYTSPPPPYHHGNRDKGHGSREREHHGSEHKKRHGDHSDHHHEGERRHDEHKGRNKDCSPKREGENHRYKSPPRHSDHHDTPYRHESPPYYKSPPYANRDYPPHHNNYIAPPKQYYPPPYYQKSDVGAAATVNAAPAHATQTSP